MLRGSEGLSYPRAATEITSHVLSSPQIGTILSVTSSYLREWVLRLAIFLVKGYICVARQYGPVYREKGYYKPEQCKESVWLYN